MEKAQCNLLNLIQEKKQQNQTFTEKEIQIIIKSCIDGLIFLKDNYIFHRDIKP